MREDKEMAMRVSFLYFFHVLYSFVKYLLRKRVFFSTVVAIYYKPRQINNDISVFLII